MVNKPALPKSTTVVPPWVGGLVEEFVLRSRYLLIPLYCFLVFEIAVIGIDFIQVLAGTIDAHALTEHTLRTLNLLDITMIANLIWLISAGSYLVFVDTNYPDAEKRPRPRALTHVSAGLLKEKMAGSLIGVSSVHLLQSFLHISTSHDTVNWNNMLWMCIIHIMFILGLVAFAWVNGLPHHQHKESTHEDHS